MPVLEIQLLLSYIEAGHPLSAIAFAEWLQARQPQTYADYSLVRFCAQYNGDFAPSPQRDTQTKSLSSRTLAASTAKG